MLKDHVEFVWIPVAVLADDSALFGAVMLDSTDRNSTLDIQSIFKRKDRDHFALHVVRRPEGRHETEVNMKRMLCSWLQSMCWLV